MSQLNQDDVLTGKSLLLLDFDGPVCSVFAGYPASQIAAELVAEVRKLDAALATDLSGETDPMEVLRAAASSTYPGMAELIDHQLCEAESLAVESAEPTPGMVDLIEAAGCRGLQIGIVSNNGKDAILKYLKHVDLTDRMAVIVGRPFGEPGLMKPEPYLLIQALNSTKTPPSEVCFIGDSSSDIIAGRAAGVTTIGYANKPGKEALLRNAGASFVVTDL